MQLLTLLLHIHSKQAHLPGTSPFNLRLVLSVALNRDSAGTVASMLCVSPPLKTTYVFHN
jgi:hypothetical protein